MFSDWRNYYLAYNNKLKIWTNYRPITLYEMLSLFWGHAVYQVSGRRRLYVRAAVGEWITEHCRGFHTINQDLFVHQNSHPVIHIIHSDMLSQAAYVYASVWRCAYVVWTSNCFTKLHANKCLFNFWNGSSYLIVISSRTMSCSIITEDQTGRNLCYGFGRHRH